MKKKTVELRVLDKQLGTSFPWESYGSRLGDRSWQRRPIRGRGRFLSCPAWSILLAQSRESITRQFCRQPRRGGWDWLNKQRLTVHDLTFNVIDEFDRQRDVSFFEDCHREFVFKFEFVFIHLVSEQFFYDFVFGFPSWLKIKLFPFVIRCFSILESFF